METSAKTAINVVEVFTAIATRLPKGDDSKKDGGVKVSDNKSDDKEKKGGCC